MKKALSVLLVLSMLIAVGVSARADSQFTTMADALETPTEYYMSGWDDSHYVYVFESNGVPWRVVSDFSAELCEQIEAVDFFDEEHDEKIAAIIGPLPLVIVEDLSRYYPDQKELDSWIGKTGQEMLDAGFEPWGYDVNGETAEFTLVFALFEYTVAVKEHVSDDDPEAVFPGLTVKGIEVNGVSSHSADWPLVYGTETEKADWDMSVPTEITGEIQTLFDQAMEGLDGVNYVPVAVLGAQDDTLCILCKATAVYPGAEPYNTLVYINDMGIQNVYELWIDKHSEKNIEETVDGTFNCA